MRGGSAGALGTAAVSGIRGRRSRSGMACDLPGEGRVAPLCKGVSRSAFGVRGLGFGVWGLRFGVWGLGFRV